MAEYYLGIDCGTQSVRAVLFDRHGETVRQARAGLTVMEPRPGWSEQDPAQWWGSLCSVLRAVMRGTKRGSLAGMGLAYQRETFVVLDNQGLAVRPAILWNDQRAGREIEEMSRDLGSEWFHRTTGKFLDTTPSAPKIKWMAAHEPHLFSRTDKLLDVGAYLHWRLTGEMTSPLAGADTLGMMDIGNSTWSARIAEYLGLPFSALPTVVASGSLAGKISPEAAKMTGLPAGLPVIAAGGDGQVFAVGAGALDPGSIALNLGTAVTLGVHATECLISPYFRTMSAVLPGHYYNESVLRAGAQIISWFGVNFGTDPAVLDEKCSAISPGCDGLITIPYWKGGMMPYNDPGARGMTIGWSNYHTKAHFYRSLLEGIAFELRLMLEGHQLASQSGARHIRLGGGGAASGLWTRIISDVTGLKIALSKSVENTALGAAMIAAWGVGAGGLREVSAAMDRISGRTVPNQQSHERYSEIFEQIYKDLYPVMREKLVTWGAWTLERVE